MPDINWLMQVNEFACLPQAAEELTEILLHQRSPEKDNADGFQALIHDHRRHRPL
jgi:hypothetical protein